MGEQMLPPGRLSAWLGQRGPFIISLLGPHEGHTGRKEARHGLMAILDSCAAVVAVGNPDHIKQMTAKNDLLPISTTVQL